MRTFKYIVVLLLSFTAYWVSANEHVIISEIMYDTPLNEQIATGQAYSNGEYIEIYNMGTTETNLSGWYLKGGGSTEIFHFPENTVIKAKASLIIAYQYVNSGFTLDMLYSNVGLNVLYQRKIILSNSGESVSLFNNLGVLVDYVYYDGNSNKTKPNRLSADNADGILGDECNSIQRKKCSFDDNKLVFSPTDWITAPVSINQISSSFITPEFLTEVYGSFNTNHNYIITTTPTIATDRLDNIERKNMLQTIAYFDGLGRPIQTVQRGITPSQHDLVTLTEYDGAGREWKQWLPKSNAGNGAFVETNIFKGISQTEYGSDTRPYSEAIIEASPLNRVLGNKGPGQAWINNPTSVSYEANTTTDAVAYFYVNDDNNLTRGANYAQATLYKTVSKDEDEKTVEEFKDKLGQVVLKRSKNGNENIDTYFVYNDLGQLAYVLPPLAADGLKSFAINNPIADSHDRLKKYGYLYKYDERGNCTFKRLPGCTPIHMVYDRADRLVLSQDGNQRNKKSTDGKRMWTATKYDVFGRVIFTGTMYRSETDSTVNYETIRNTFANELVIDNYNSNGFGSCNPLVINYYDSYNFINDLVLPSPLSKTELEHKSKTGYDAQYSPPSGGRGAAGLLTGTRTYLLDGSGDYTVSAIYYDYRGRVVQTRATNHLGGYDITYNELNFSGQPLKTLKEHSIAASINAPLTELYTHNYDHAGRLRFTKYKINNKPEVVLVDNTAPGAYDELGRLKIKRRHSVNNGPFEDSEEFDYNIRNWTERITSGVGTNKFEQKLFYNTDLPTGATPLYNGNISAQTWTYNNQLNNYVYNYDNMNRLISGGVDINHDTSYKYAEFFLYDKMGNITSLIRFRNSYEMIDNLSFIYNGNQITAIGDEYGSQNLNSVKEYQDKSPWLFDENEMAYDGNGNLTKDLDRDIVTIRYNLLNLPEIVQFKNGNQIRNTYDASGRKLGMRYATVQQGVFNPIIPGQVIENLDVSELDNVSITGTDYVGNIEYNVTRYFDWDVTYEPQEGKTLWQVYNPEGYTTHIRTSMTHGPIYHYYRKDHLGNNREVWRASHLWNGNTRAAATVERTQYYPSGLPWASNFGDNPGTQSKKYNGKKFVEMHGLDEYDYHARGMYPAIMRFTTIDPLAEDYYDVSPYAYVLNNPLRYTDPTGMSSENANDKEDIDGGELTEVTVVASKYDPIGTRAMDAVEGFWEWAEYIAYGRTYQSNVQNTLIKVWRVDHNGIIVGAQPLTGTPPIPSLKNSELFIKGFGYVDKLKFHRIIKPKILKKANELVNYQKIVGKNPDIVIDSGKIILQGAKNSPYAGNTLKVNLNIIDILKKHLY